MRKSGLRKANAVISALMLALFLVHAVGNAFQLIGVGSPLSKGLSHGLTTLVVLHAAIGVWLTVATFRAQRAAGAAYPLLNKRFWAIRISGALIAVLIAAHVVVFTQPSSDPVRLHGFGAFELALSVLLVVVLVVHVLSAAEGLLISLGVARTQERAHDIAFALVVLAAFMVAAFCVYYLRWAVV